MYAIRSYYEQKFDFVVSRAVTAMPVFVDWVKPLFLKKSRNAVPNGILALKGGSLEEELQLPYPTHIMNLADWYQEEFFVTRITSYNVCYTKLLRMEVYRASYVGRLPIY